ncbi:MAG: signal peptidase II [Clostridiales bacterium]|nr:signal peptidase II [Candidatus Coliplasma caballi]
MLILLFSIVLGSVALDQITKLIVVSSMKLHEEVPFLPGFIRFYRTENTGAAFSLFADHRWVFMVFSGIAMAAIAVILVKWYRRHPLLTASLAMILGGGIGNMIDRVANGYVVDFIDFQFMNFAVFNVADIFVTCGSVLLAVYILLFEAKAEPKQKANASEESDDGTDAEHDGTDGTGNADGQ